MKSTRHRILFAVPPVMSLFALLGLGAFAPANLARFVEPSRGATPEPRAALTPKASELDKAQFIPDYGKVPLSFEANEGQTDRRVKFLAHGAGYSLFLTPREVVLALSQAAPKTLSLAKKPTAVLRTRLLGASPAPRIAASEELPGRSNYFIGNAPSQWRTNIPTYARVDYESVYPGVDLVYHGDEGELEYDFIVAPGAGPRSIRLGFQGIRRLHIDANGDLVLVVDGSEIREHRPLVYQQIDGAKKVIAGSYRLSGKREVGFEVGPYDAAKPLIIDPVLSYSTYLGGSGNDLGVRIAVDSSGNAYVTGVTQSADFPTARPKQAKFGGNEDAFITKLNPSGSALVYSTYLGGSNEDQGSGIAVDASGNAYVTGLTCSGNFPIARPLQARNAGQCNAFVAKLNASGTTLVYSTYLGGSAVDSGVGIAVDASGSAYVTGGTGSINFPTVNAVQRSLGGGMDGFVAKLNAPGSALVYSTYLGGTSDDSGLGIAADSSGNAYVTGFTLSNNFPTRNPVQSTFGGGTSTGDAFAAKLDAAGSLVYSTYLGGGSDDSGRAITVDSSGNSYVTGYTLSGDFPLASPLQSVFNRCAGSGCFTVGGDAFVAKLNASGSALVYSTYLGGSRNDQANGIAVDSSGNAYVTGSTASSDFPTVNPVQGTLHGGSVASDAFVAELNASGSALVYSTYLGGSGGDSGDGIALDTAANAYVTGYTESTDFPTANPLQASNAGSPDNAFVARILPFGFAAFAPHVEIEAEAPSTLLVNGTFSLDLTSSGINPPADLFILQTGTFTCPIPAGRFMVNSGGAFSFNGKVKGVILEVLITPLGGNSYQLSARATGAKVTASTSPLTVQLIIGGNGGSATATPTL